MPKLHVVTAGRESHIRVPVGRAAALAKYLLTNGVVVSRPEPCTADTQTVTVVGKVDAAALQGLLDGWE